ncbi:hypothetical protein GCM10009828_071320 [Actinoplanes couchii]|uniref:Glycosyltransferase RgtA/B/C/D-like domain-containing protein n=1 Tax=Actinoplanes couchii TaxID=403638 RepID=A0ABQ3X655_9ACTN|nr:hypothetical protein Aco03nite_024010 [Actinoplanes couchii]
MAPSLLPGVAMLAIGRIGLLTPLPGPDEGTGAASAAMIIDLGRDQDSGRLAYHLFLHYWTVLTGDSLAMQRLPSLIAVALAAALTGELGRRLLTPGAGLCAGLLLVSLPIVNRAAQGAEPWGPALFLATLATLLLYLAMDRPGWVRWLGYGTAVALTGLAHPAALLILAGHSWTVFSRWRLSRERALFWWFPVTVLSLVPPAPLLSLGVRQHTGLFTWHPGTPWDLARAAPAEFFGSLTAGLVLIGLALAARWTDRELLRELTALAVLPPLLLLAASFLTGPLRAPRHVLIALPAVALCAAAAVRGLRLRTLIAVVLVAALGVPGQHAVRRADGHLVTAYRAAPPGPPRCRRRPGCAARCCRAAPR